MSTNVKLLLVVVAAVVLFAGFMWALSALGPAGHGHQHGLAPVRVVTA